MNHAPLSSAADRASLQNSAIALIVLGFLCGGTLPAIFGIIALVQLDSDPHSARKMTKVGWILFWVVLALIVLFVVIYIVFFAVIFGIATLPLLTS